METLEQILIFTLFEHFLEHQQHDNWENDVATMKQKMCKLFQPTKENN